MERKGRYEMLEAARVQRTARFKVPRTLKPRPARCDVCAWRQASYEAGTSRLCQACAQRTYPVLAAAIADRVIKPL